MRVPKTFQAFQGARKGCKDVFRNPRLAGVQCTDWRAEHMKTLGRVNPGYSSQNVRCKVGARQEKCALRPIQL